MVVLGEPTTKELLRDGLFAEESEGDLPTARKNYEALLAKHAEEKKVAAVALYRLAEIERKQGKKQQAVVLYQQLLAEFGEVEPQAKLTRENLKALGVEPDLSPLQKTRVEIQPEEARALRQFQKDLKDSPDRIKDPKHLQTATKDGWVEVMRFLLKNGADANEEGILELAAVNGHLSVCQLLMQYGCDPTLPKHEGAMIGAVKNNNLEVVKLLLEKGADPKKMQKGWLVNLAMTKDLRLDVFRVICDAGYPVGELVAELPEGLQTGQYGGVIHRAAFLNRPDMIKACLDYHVPINQVHPEVGMTALHVAAFHGNLEALRASFHQGKYLEQKTKPDLRLPHVELKKGGYTALQLAERHEIIRTLVEAGAKADTDVLCRVIHSQDFALVREIVESGVELNGVDAEGQSPLSCAMVGVNQDLIEYLTARGAKIEDHHWQTANARLKKLWMTHHVYPALSEGEEVTLCIPELGFSTKIANGGIKEGELRHLLPSLSFPNAIKCEIPLLDFFQTNPASLKWRITRNDVGNDVRLVDLMELEFFPGEVIELTGVLEDEYIVASVGSEVMLSQAPPSDLKSELMKFVQTPVTLVFKDREYKLTLSGDCLYRDARTLVFPHLDLTSLMEMIVGDAVCNDRVRLRLLKNGESEGVELKGGSLGRIKLGQGDEIRIDATQAEFIHEMGQGHGRSVVGFVFPNRLAMPAFVIRNLNEVPNLGQLLTELFTAYPAESLAELARNKDVIIPEDYSLALHVDLLIPFVEQSRFYPTVYPNLDLSRIKIHRKKKTGESEVLEVDLLKKIRAWAEGEIELADVNIELQVGDLIELHMKDGAREEIDEDVAAYLKEVNEWPLVYFDSSGTMKDFEYHFSLPVWERHEGKEYPLRPPGTVAGLRSEHWSKGKRYRLQTDLEGFTGNFLVEPYWPQKGHRLHEYNAGQKQPRTRYVPRPQK